MFCYKICQGLQVAPTKSIEICDYKLVLNNYLAKKMPVKTDIIKKVQL